jgi:hypothetical protein
MCDYCSCRLQPLIGELGAQHEDLLDRTGRIERALDAGDLTTAHAELDLLDAELEPHLRLEERSLFPALASDALFGDTLSALERDHAAVRAAEPPLTDDDWVPFARRHLAELRAHIFVEETDVFPAAVQFVAPAVWDEAEVAAQA